MFGKITVIKSLLLPKLAFSIQTLHIPTNIIKQIKSMIFSFLWGNNEKIKRNTLIGNKLEGGLDVPDIEIYEKSLKLKWIKSLGCDEHANWKVIPKFFLNQYGKNLLILKMNLDSIKSLPPIKYPLSQFYNDILAYYVEFNNLTICKKPTSFHDIRSQIIWGNRFIKHNGKCVIFLSWINSGITYVNDIINDAGEVSETTILDK